MRRNGLISFCLFLGFSLSSKRKGLDDFNPDNELKKSKTCDDAISNSNCITVDSIESNEFEKLEFYQNTRNIQFPNIDTVSKLLNARNAAEDNSFKNVDNMTEDAKSKDYKNETEEVFEHLESMKEHYVDLSFVDLLCLCFLKSGSRLSDFQHIQKYSYSKYNYILSLNPEPYIYSYAFIRSSDLFFASKYLYTFLSIKYTTFLNNKKQFDPQMAINIFGPKVLSIIESKINLYIFSDDKDILNTLSGLSNEINQLIKFIASIPNLVDEFKPYFKYMMRGELSTREEFLAEVTKKIIEILGFTKLKYLKTYLPELYSLEILLGQIKFASLESAIAGYILIFFMQNSIENMAFGNIDKRPNDIQSIFSLKEFNTKMLKFECIFSVLTLCLNNRDLYFGNYRYIISEYVYLINKTGKYFQKINHEIHIFKFFKKNLFFYLEFDVSNNVIYDFNKNKIFNFAGNISQLSGFNTFKMEKMEEIKRNFETLRAKHSYLDEILKEDGIDLNSLEKIDEINTIFHYIYTFKVEHCFNLNKVKASIKSKLKISHLIK